MAIKEGFISRTVILEIDNWKWLINQGYSLSKFVRSKINELRETNKKLEELKKEESKNQKKEKISCL